MNLSILTLYDATVIITHYILLLSYGGFAKRRSENIYQKVI